MKNLSRPIKILLAVLFVLAFLILIFIVGNFIYCHTVVICEPPHETMSPEMIATITAQEYELAIQEINSGQYYERAKQRLEYVIRQNPEYPGAAEKLLEVEKILATTATP